ncbi:MAG: UDP-2,3-diacylglucosamine diphosphatase [Xanthobacteraceae bacterium]
MIGLLFRLLPRLETLKLYAAAVIVVASSYRIGISLGQHRYAGGGLVFLVSGLYWQRTILQRRASRGITRVVAGLLQSIVAAGRESRDKALNDNRRQGDIARMGPPRRQGSPVKVRSIFISDVHLGTRGSQAGLLADFLESFDAEAMFLVGDIVDGWRLKSSWYWPASHDEVLLKLIDAARGGCRIVYLAGNHDEFLRRHIGTNFARVEIAERVLHHGADGRTYLIVHGDQFDAVVRHARWIAIIGDWAYRSALVLNVWLDHVRRRFGKPYWSFSAWAKMKVKKAVNHISHFEEAVCAEARRHGAQGVICGHIHHPAMHDAFDVRYVNTGDWVESCSAVVEHEDGQFEIIRWTNGARSLSGAGRGAEALA